MKSIHYVPSTLPMAGLKLMLWLRRQDHLVDAGYPLLSIALKPLQEYITEHP
jgi:hypothetical protein